MPYERRIIEYRMVSPLQSIMMKPAGPMSDVAFKRVVPMDELSQKPLLPYFFNLQSERLFFTTTSSLAEVLAAPFIYEAQVAFLNRLYSVPLEQLESLGWPEVDNSNLMFILSIGRCGSTLLSHMLNVNGRSALSEFDIFGQLGMAKARDIPLLGSIVIDDVLRHSVAAIHALAPSGQGLAFKMQTQANPLIGAYLNTFPDATFVFLLREPAPWFASLTRAFGTTPGEGAAMYLTHLDELTDMVAAHPHTMVLHYQDLIEQPRQVVEADLARTGGRLSNHGLAHIDKVLATDSQKDTRLSRDRLKDKAVPQKRIETFKATFLAKLNAHAVDLSITTSAISNEPILLD